MEKKMQAEKHGSQWDIMMNVLIDSGKYVDKNAYVFKGEIATIDFLNQNPELRFTESNAFVLYSQSLRRWISRLNEKRTRSADLTNRLRQGGNQYFAELPEPFDVAADYYTKAIFSAPKDSVELAMAHANRAACSLRIIEFLEEGYYDCTLALKYNYPMNKRDKLLKRKFYLAGDVEKSEETLRQMEDLVEQNIFTEAQLKLQTFREQLDAMKNQMKESTKQIDGGVFENKQIIEKFDKSLGRYVVAGEHIKKNQPIYREKAFAFVPVYNDYYPDTIPYHCQNCAKTNCIPFPCYDCVRASYCSSMCVDQHKNIHKYECAGYQKNLWMKIGIAHLAFRNFIVGFNDAIEKLDQNEFIADLDADTLLEKLTTINDVDFVYGDVLRLITNFDKMKASDCLRYALTAQLLAIYLDECTDFFTNLPEKCTKIMSNIEDWKKFTAAIFMRHMGQLVSNGHAISDIELMPPSLCDYSYRDCGPVIMVNDLHLVSTSSRIFTAIFPKISMLNHSCDPNICNSFDGPFLSIYASRDIAKDEEIFNCYGPNYKLMSKSERQTALKQQYCFDCKCEKCINNDQTYMKYHEYICPNENCRSSISFDFPDRQWWHYLHDNNLMSQIAPKFNCKKCKKILLLNPCSLKDFFEATSTENDLDFQFYRKRRQTEAAASYYMAVSKCLSKYHELKAVMAQALLRYQMHADQKEMFSTLAYIAMDNYIIARERFGQYSLETVMATTYALNVLKMAKELELDRKSQKLLPEIEKIRKVFDVKKMEKSFKVLSKPMQAIFKNAIKEIDETTKLSSHVSKLKISNESDDLSSDGLTSDDSDSID